MQKSLIIKAIDEQAMYGFARQLASCIKRSATLLSKKTNHSFMSAVIYLTGDLGAGKTTIARGFVQFFGFDKVKSPTYTLVETYKNSQIEINHFDLYRLNDPEELEYIGIREYAGVQLIEWAELGAGSIQPADLHIKITGTLTRKIELTSASELGAYLQQCLILKIQA